MIHGILIGISIFNIITLIIGGDHFHTMGWVCCLCITISDLRKTEKIKSLEEITPLI